MKKFLIILGIIVSLILGGYYLLVYLFEDHHLTYYEYNGVTVTQFDEPGETFFYYGKYKRLKDCPDSYVRMYYSGIDGSRDGYIIFDKDSITIMRTVGYSEEHNLDKRMHLVEYGEDISPEESRKWHDSIDGNYNNVAGIANIMSQKDYAIDYNARNNSKVKITYVR